MALPCCHCDTILTSFRSKATAALPTAKDTPAPTDRKGKRRAIPPAQPVEEDSSTVPSRDRKGKKRAVPQQATSNSDDPASPAKRPKCSSSPKYQLRSSTADSSTSSKTKTPKSTPKTGKKPKRTMPKKPTPSKKSGQSSAGDRSKKGDTSARHLIDHDMEDDEHHWAQAGGSGGAGLLGDDHFDEDVDMDDSDHDDDDDEDQGHDGNGGGHNYDRLSRLTDGALFDEAAAALFGGDFRGFGGMMSGVSNMFKRLRTNLRSPKSSVRLAALRECSDLLLVSNEDTLGGSFSTTAFATEFIAILSGKPNIDKAEDDKKGGDADAMDEDAELAAVLAMTGGGSFGGDEQDEMEAQLLACRCLAHLIEALPGSGHNLVHLGAVPVLCSKLNEISYIELAEQTLSVSSDF